MKTPDLYFGENVFNENVMRERLSEETFNLVKLAIDTGKRLDISVADDIANAMKDWALEKGATHYTHWFQPMTGITAEKHDSFINPSKDGKIIMAFSGKELIRGESDASSFPSGGLRATFEARGYTAWDPTSYAFIKDNVLYIPTAFCSYGGEALDKKTPLLRSMEAINRQIMRVLKLLGEEVKGVKTTVGPEQEYFLIDKDLYLKRKDLVFTGRTLLGAKPPKGQELDDHYFGVIKPCVKQFMTELDTELWKLGVLAKTEHNEAAPAQHELAPVYATTNIAADHNQLTMELMQKIAKKYNMVCLLHEKPFAGVNGSGKHNNWSISTLDGDNIFEPGDTPAENARFLLFLCAVLAAVDDYQALIRLSVASAGNDHRLGANEAPPAVLSVFLGDELTEILEAIEEDKLADPREKQLMKIGVHVLPKFPKDTTDRNRTSPFAFTGNKFEFRMLGSSESISETNVVINTAVAEELRIFADRLEKADDLKSELHTLIKETIKKHKRIIFNGNGYDDAWLKEAEKRGLLNLPSTPDAIPYLLEKKSIDLFATHKVYTETELKSRFEILNENYCKVLRIEALTLIDMLKRDILPALSRAACEISRNISAQSKAGVTALSYDKDLLGKIVSGREQTYAYLNKLVDLVEKSDKIVSCSENALFIRNNIFETMQQIRKVVDPLEECVPKDIWPYPSYADLLFGL